MSEPTIVVAQGAARREDLPGVEVLDGVAALRFAPDGDALRAALPGAEVVLGWNFRANLEHAWELADELRWIHWCGAGVDTVLFPPLVESGVVLTNARGVFDGAMAEYVLGLALAFAKRVPETVRFQQRREWNYRLTERIEGTRALVVGTGSIGRAIARLLAVAGVGVEGVGRTARTGNPDFGIVHGSDGLVHAVAQADWVVLVAPLTSRTEGMIDAEALRAMKPTARLINVGRGRLVDESALVDALRRGEIAGAGLDVFAEEPLPAASPLWEMDNVIVSPHMSGDYEGFGQTLVELFAENLRRYRAGEPLRNVVDKRAGFAAASR